MDQVDSRPWYRRRSVLIFAGALCAVAAYFAVSGQSSQPGKERGHHGKPGEERPVVVGTAPVRLGDVPEYLSGLGTVTPRNVVTVHSRVDGELVKVLFTEGQFVKAGTLLAQIDPRPYQVVLTQAQGAMARDAALLKNAQLDAERYRKLLAQDSTSQQQVDTQAALVRQYEGTVEADRGQVASAQLSLTYTRITAPIAGVVGLRQVDPGNIVHASDANGIAVIAQIRPMTVVFAIPETRVSAMIKRMAEPESVQVEAWDRDNKNRLAVGKLTAVDNQVDATTGTVKLKAEFPNDDSSLFPNQFVNARALVDVRKDVPVVPASAVQNGNDGAFVFVVQEDQTAKVRPVTTGISNENIVSIARGLQAGEIVVVDGLDRLRDGSRISAARRGASGALSAAAGNAAAASASGHGGPSSGSTAQGTASTGADSAAEATSSKRHRRRAFAQ